MNKSLHKNIEIGPLDKMGCGIATINGRNIQVPYTLPGEVCDIELPKEKKGQQPLAKVVATHKGSDQRVAPLCRHYTKCGGCSLQHLSKAAYNKFKTDAVTQSLVQYGLDASVINDIIKVPVDSRRRTTLKVQDGLLGYYAFRSHRHVPIKECVILAPELQALISPLSRLLQGLECKKRIYQVQLLASDNGVAVVCCIKGRDAPDLTDLEKIVSWAKTHDLASVYYNNDQGRVPIIEERFITLRCGEVTVPVAIDGFQQASKHAQNVISEQIKRSLSGADKILDLYAGCGTYSFSLGKKKKIHAIEGDASMVSTMQEAARKYNIASYISAEKKDLYNSPLTSKQLNEYDAVIINPPRNGAGPQIKQLAGASVKYIIIVSCDAKTFARDAALLLSGNYRSEYIKNIDQFIFSNHIETVGFFSNIYLKDS